MQAEMKMMGKMKKKVKLSIIVAAGDYDDTKTRENTSMMSLLELCGEYSSCSRFPRRLVKRGAFEPNCPDVSGWGLGV